MVETLYIIFFIFAFSIINTSKSNLPVNETKEINDEFSYIKDIKNYVVLSDSTEVIDIDMNTLYKLLKNGLLESENYIEKYKNYLVDINILDNELTGNFNILVYDNKFELKLYDYYNYNLIIEIRS